MQDHTGILAQDFILGPFQISLIFPCLTFCIFTVLLQFTQYFNL